MGQPRGASVNWIQLLKKSSPYLVMVILAFILMGVVGFRSARDVTRRHWRENSQNNLRTAEANVAEGLARSELMLLNAYHVVRRILDRGDDFTVVQTFLKDTTEWVTGNQYGVPGFYGLYAYLEGEFIDGINLNPGSDFIPVDRPWFKTGQGLDRGQVGYTAPYTDWRTGGTIVSAVQKLYSSSGDRYYGLLVLDIDLNWFSQYLRVLSQAPGNYGMLLNQDLRVIWYPYEEWLGLPLSEMGDDYSWVAVELLRQDGQAPVTGDIASRRIKDGGGREMRVVVRQMFNGWYLILHTPMQNYNREIYGIRISLTFAGMILILLLSAVMLRINAAQIRSDEISAYKTTFLAHISHEIRTPMNAVIGMSELALREHRQTKIMEYLGGIKQAGQNLLSIINDILDISKIEAGTLQITPASYFFASLLNDVVSIIRVEIAEKPLIFAADVDPNIPNVLLGDEARIRQVLLNLLNNAVKYTQQGYIDLRVRVTSRNEDRSIVLRFEVADSGLGIRKEDQEGIFESFVRLEGNSNKSIEGTGLGLVISRRLCRAMGGDVIVASEYGKGSVFTATITQTVVDSDPLAVVDSPADKRVLVYEERDYYARSIFRSLGDLGVYAYLCRQPDDFYRELERGTYTYALVSSRLIKQAADSIREKSIPTSPVFLADSGDMVSHNNIPMLVMPAYSVPLANVLNNRAVYDRRKNKRVRFIVPSARILIVDDSATNLKVAEGLLSLYRSHIDTCFDGRAALDLVMKNEYDLVFMDHTMPEMDGIQATAEIRGMLGRRFTTMPIIALTANAITGMKEMFLANGFSDYLSKPIEIAKLDEIMIKWISRDKQIITGDTDDAPVLSDGLQIE
ncbi:MAG: response regulator, partial [Treponema sp.]|nr:response regulator [Treponema sp.]